MSEDRRDPNNPPRPGMTWSEKHQLWMDPDTRTEAEKAKDEAIAREACKKAGHVACPNCGQCRDADSWTCDVPRGLAYCPMCNMPTDLNAVLRGLK